MDDHPNAQDFANKAEHDAARLDEWRVEQAKLADPTERWAGSPAKEYAEYRRLVRDDVRP